MSDETLPKGTRLAAWSWIVLGVLTVIVALLGSFLIDAAQEMMAAGDIPGMPAMRNAGMDAGSGLVLALHNMYAIAAIAGGVKLLQRRAWARTALEVLCWVSLVLAAVLAVTWIVMWNSITVKMLGQNANTAIVWAIGLGVDLVLTALCAVPLWKMVRFLRSAPVRDAMRSDPSS